MESQMRDITSTVTAWTREKSWAQEDVEHETNSHPVAADARSGKVTLVKSVGWSWVVGGNCHARVGT